MRKEWKNNTRSNPEENRSPTIEGLLNSSILSNSNVLLQTAFAIAQGPNKNCLVKIIFDGGSHLSFIREDIANNLQFPVIKRNPIKISTFGEETSKEWETKIVLLTLRNVEDPELFDQLELFIAPFITQRVKIPDDLGYQLERQGIQFIIPRTIDAINADITILIGAQDMWRFCYENDIRRLNKSGVAINSLFGWTVQGIINIENEVESFVCNLSIEKEEGFDCIKRFWELESFGIGKELINEEEISDDVIALEQFEKYIKLKENRYEIRL